MDEHKTEWEETFAAWKNARSAADAVREHLGRKPGVPIAFMTTDDVNLMNAKRLTWEKLLKIARKPTDQ